MPEGLSLAGGMAVKCKLRCSHLKSVANKSSDSTGLPMKTFIAASRFVLGEGSSQYKQ
jgi:hypothetical protein